MENSGSGIGCRTLLLGGTTDRAPRIRVRALRFLYRNSGGLARSFSFYEFVGQQPADREIGELSRQMPFRSRSLARCRTAEGFAPNQRRHARLKDACSV